MLIFEYYHSIWIKEISVNMFSVDDRKHRTNNALESYHARFGREVGRHAPNIFMLMHFLLQEQVATDNTLANLKVGLIVSYPASDNVRIDRQIERHKRNYAAGNISEDSFLTAIGHCLHACIRIEPQKKHATSQDAESESEDSDESEDKHSAN